MTILASETTRQERPKKKKAVAAVLAPARPSIPEAGSKAAARSAENLAAAAAGCFSAYPNAHNLYAEIVKLHRHGAGDGSYDEALATEILDLLAEGKTLRAICREPNTPSARTVSRWATNDIHGFADRYDRARKMQGDAIFDEVIDITNEKFVDIVEVQAARLKVDARKWFLAKLHPERFGDKVEITSRTEKLSDEQVDAQLLGLLEGSDYAALSPKHSGARNLLAKPDAKRLISRTFL